MSNTWSYDAEQAVAGVLGLVPGVGSLLSALTYILWPSTDNVWDDIKAQVEALVAQDLSDYETGQINDTLTGLKGVITEYTTTAGGDDPSAISATWISANTQFIASAPKFQDATYAVLLLPQFAQFANLHLSLLRDGVLFGSSWGWTADYLQQQQQLLTQTLKDYVSYVDTTYQQSFTPLVPGILDSPLKPPIPPVAAPPYLGSMNTGQTLFLWTNTYVRQMTRMVLDFATLWPYFDPSAYPPPVSIQLKSEIYSDPIGTAEGWNGLPSAPTQPMSQLTVWGASNIFAVQATYPQGAGPNGATTTPRLGNPTAGSSTPPLGGTFDVAANPITTASVLVSGGEPFACLFTFQDGSQAITGDTVAPSVQATYAYDGQIVSSVFINGVTPDTGADCIIFGFQYAAASAVSMSVLRTLYVSAPKVSSLPEFLEVVQPDAAGRKDVAALAEAQGWEAERAAYQAGRKARTQGQGAALAS